VAGRYLLIEFDDAASADALRAQIDNASHKGKRFRVVGLFSKPTGYCQCDPQNHVTTRSNTSTLKRGKKFGWWVCSVCKRPAPSLSGLRNLLKPRDIIDPPRWMSKHYQKGPDFEAMHYIPSLSGEACGPGSVEFWNTRS
jgi:hypothetical protein